VAVVGAANAQTHRAGAGVGVNVKIAGAGVSVNVQIASATGLSITKAAQTRTWRRATRTQRQFHYKRMSS